MLNKKVATTLVAGSIATLAIPSVALAAHDEEASVFAQQKPMVVRPVDARDVQDSRDWRDAREVRDPRNIGPMPVYGEPRQVLPMPMPAPTYNAPVTHVIPAQVHPQLSPVLPQSGYGTPPFVPAPAPHTPPRTYDEPHMTYAPATTYYHAPPPPRYEIVPAARRGLVWVPGYWDVQDRYYVWVDGYFVRDRRGHAFRPARWERTANGWVLSQAHFVREFERDYGRDFGRDFERDRRHEYGRYFDRDGDGIPNHHDRAPDDSRRF